MLDELSLCKISGQVYKKFLKLNLEPWKLFFFCGWHDVIESVSEGKDGL